MSCDPWQSEHQAAFESGLFARAAACQLFP